MKDTVVWFLASLVFFTALFILTFIVVEGLT
jgi:hypothetical protein